MYEQEKRDLVETAFSGKFDKKNFRDYIASLAGDPSCNLEWRDEIHAGGQVYHSHKESVKSFTYLCKFTDGMDEIGVCIVKLDNFKTLQRSRSFQRSLIARYMNDRGKTAALVAFYTDDDDEWRFSFVREQYGFTDGKPQRELTPIHRSSFLVGGKLRQHTARQQLLDLLQTPVTLETLQTAFKVEPVTKKFYEEYRVLYNKLHKKLAEAGTIKGSDGNPIAPKDFAKHLLGQLVFIYFLQKKRWLGADTDRPFYEGKDDFLRWLYDESDSSQDFYDDRLTYLLHQALAEKRGDGSFIYEEFGCKIPYLNGGLFEPFRGYDWKHTKLQLGNDIFEEILQVFDTYNFTVCEDEPLENEVAVDPEMLGKVFENLIEDNERKGSGTYYTPRKVVYYMCQEALIDYLHHELSIDRTALEEFVITADKHREHNLTARQKQDNQESGDTYKFIINKEIEANAEAINTALAEVKICDPAVGSGAFPVAMMLEITRLRMLLNSFLSEKNNSYDCKKHCIENSLYGVDLDPSAVDIACLRFWLSLAIDDEEKAKARDYVETLPNLKYKIIVGDGLKRRDIELLNYEEFKGIEAMKRDYFNKEDKNQKKDLDEDIKISIYKMIEKHGYDVRLYFSELFHEKGGGFDIVIANPPYIQLAKNKGELGRKYKPFDYKSHMQSGDIYMLFYERAMEFLKIGGRQAFITSNSWMRMNGGKELRKFFVEETTPELLLDLGADVFDTATVDTNILVARNIREKGGRTEFRAAILYGGKGENLRDFVKDNAILMSRPYEYSPWIIMSKQERILIDRIKGKGAKLKSWGISMFRGITTGYNEAFIIDTETKDRLIKEDPNSANIIKPLLRGKDIKKWGIDYKDKWIITTFPAAPIKIDDYPAIKKHFLLFGKERLEQSGKKGARKETSHKWFETQDSTQYYKDFEKEKIIYSEISQYPQFYYDAKGEYHILNTSFMIAGKHIKFLIAVLNSSISHAIYAKFFAGTGLGDEGIRYLKKYLQELPIPKIPQAEQKPFIDLVDKITTQDNTAALEKQLDDLVTQLFTDHYSLTPSDLSLLNLSSP